MGLDLERPVVVAVGPSAALGRSLRSFGAAEVVNLRAVDELSSPARAIEQATADEVRLGRAAVASAIAAHGGQALRDVHDTIVEAEMAIVLRGQTANGRLRQVRKDPYRLKIVTTVGPQQTSQVLDGRQAWSLLPGDSALRVADSAQVASLRAIYRLDSVRLLRAAADSSTRVAGRGREVLEQGDAERVDVLFADGSTRRLFFDPVSHRLMAVDLTGLAALLAPSRWTFDDYRLVQGVWWPFHERRLISGQPFMELRATSVQINAGVGDEEFAAPASVPKGTSR